MHYKRLDEFVVVLAVVFYYSELLASQRSQAKIRRSYTSKHLFRKLYLEMFIKRHELLLKGANNIKHIIFI